MEFETCAGYCQDASQSPHINSLTHVQTEQDQEETNTRFRDISALEIASPATIYLCHSSAVRIATDLFNLIELVLTLFSQP